ncbi:MAG: hypothetical protein U5R14_14855 [Gemmatimonadota bacterium]|nr:hypothetical protein [Gemmatimonadota bacterium]
MRKQRAKQQLGQEAPRAQERALDLVADRSPGEVRSLMNRWVTVLLVVGALLGVGGALTLRLVIGGGDRDAHAGGGSDLPVAPLAGASVTQLVELAEQFGKPSGG